MATAQQTAKEKARAQRRADRKAGRKNDYAKQKGADGSTAANFDYNQHNKKGSEGTHVSGQEAKFLRQNYDKREALASLKAQQESGAQMGQRAQNQMARMEQQIANRDSKKAARIDARKKAKAVKDNPITDQPYDPPAQSPNPEDTPATQPPKQTVEMGNVEGHDNQGGIGNTNVKDTGDIEQNTDITNTQKTDNHAINSQTVTNHGDNSYIDARVDQSVKSFGGDNRTMIINEANTGAQGGSGSSNGGYYNTADKAITMATLGGFYAPDDSPAGQAKFVALNQDLNATAQKRYAGDAMAVTNKYSGFRGGNYDAVGMEQAVAGAGDRFRDMATVADVNTYGDRDAAKGGPSFEFGDPIEEVTSNADEIAEGYKDDIDDM